jgi:hypothetical protein
VQVADVLVGEVLLVSVLPRSYVELATLSVSPEGVEVRLVFPVVRLVHPAVDVRVALLPPLSLSLKV